MSFSQSGIKMLLRLTGSVAAAAEGVGVYLVCCDRSAPALVQQLYLMSSVPNVVHTTVPDFHFQLTLPEF